jgi:hypothetical protein
VIVGAFTEVAGAWSAFGLSPDDSVVREFLMTSPEDEMYSKVRELAEDFVATGEIRFIRSLSGLTYRLLAAGRDYDAPLLTEFALGLCYAQAELLQ